VQSHQETKAHAAQLQDQVALLEQQVVGRGGRMGPSRPQHLPASSAATAVVLPQIQVFQLYTSVGI
jgi:hypothetical protein